MNVTLQATGITFIAAAIIGGGVEAFGIKLPLLNSTKRQLMLASFGGLLLIVPFATDALRQKTLPSDDSRQKNVSAQSSFHITLATLTPDNQHRVRFAIDRTGSQKAPPSYTLNYMLERKIGDGFVEQLNLNVPIGDSNEALSVATNGLSQSQMHYLAGPVTEKALHIEKSGDVDELKRAIAAVVIDIH